MKTIPLLVLACLFAASLTAQEVGPIQDTPDPTQCGSRVMLERIWARILELHDKNGDGRVGKREYTRGEVQFGNYDYDGDGVLTDADFPEEAWYNGFGPGVAREADANRNREVTRDEWKAYMAKLDPDGNGEMTQEEFARVYSPVMAARMSIVALSFDQNLDGKVTVEDYLTIYSDLDRNKDGVLNGVELQPKRGVAKRPRGPAPKAGEMAPDFDLPLADDADKTVRLSSFRGNKPVALIFGSYT